MDRAATRREALWRARIPLAKIGEALAALPAQRTPTVADGAQLAQVWRADLEARIEQLIRLRDELNGRTGCGCLSIEACRPRNPQDILSGQGPGARLLEA